MKKIPYIKKVIHNTPFIISGMALAAMHAPSIPIFVIIIAVLVIALIYLDDIFDYWKTNISILSFFISIVLLFFWGKTFYSSMCNNKHSTISALLGMNIETLAAFCTLLGVIASFYFLSTIISVVYSTVVLDVPCQHTSQFSCPQNATVTERELLIILVTAITVITICSKSSPIYPFNDWLDANCYMTVGKSMLHGLVPYRDLYEQKGPLLYMLHAIAALISKTRFMGVYFLEISAAGVFLFFSAKTLKLYQQSAIEVLVPILAVVVYSSASFCHGDSAEEFCLPLFSFAIYLAVKYVRQEQCPTLLECMAVGITSAFVLWIKFSMLGFYLGWFFVIVWQTLRCKAAKKLFRIVLWIGVGTLIPTIPILIYFGINHALSDLWTVYFYDNLFLYSNVSSHIFPVSLALNLVGGMKNVLSASPIPSALIGTGLLALLKKKEKTEFCTYLIMSVFTFLLVYIGGRHYIYYALIFSAFVPVGILSVYQTLKTHFTLGCQNLRISPSIRKYSAGLLCAGSIIFAFVMCNNTYLLKYSKADLPQYQFAEIVSQKENATLLNYGFLDGGFYTTTGIIPNCKYFCDLNIELDEIMKTQDAFVESGKVDFVVTRDTKLQSDLYELIADTTFYYEGLEREYFLYQLIS